MTTKLKDRENTIVLWVDDNPSLRKLAERALSKAGFECVTASSGDEAITMMEHIDPDLILLDIEMPGMNGFETCASIQVIRKQSGHDLIPILMVSGHDDLEYLEQAYDLGINDIVLKPINWKSLVYRMRFILNASNSFETTHPSFQQQI
ncbi:MAG: response regulator [Methylococcales bacterium]